MTTIETHSTEIGALVDRVVEAAADPRYEANKKMWTAHNRLQKTAKTPVFVCLKRGNGPGANPVTWNELIPHDTRVCTDPVEMDIELQLRQKLYKHDHIPDDEVLLPTLWVSAARSGGASDGGASADFEAVDATRTAQLWGMPIKEINTGMVGGAYAVDPVINEDSDMDQLQAPQFEVDEAATALRVEHALNTVDGKLPVHVRTDELGYSPTEIMISLMGMEQVLYGVIDRPAFIHRLMDFITDAMIDYHQQREQAGRVDPEQTWGYRVQYEELPTDEDTHKLKFCWPTVAAQSTVGLSPTMYAEFVQPYHNRLAATLGEDRVYYHGCEDLTKKIPSIRTLPNLRRFHVSPWTDLESTVEQLGTDFVLEVVGHPDVLHVMTREQMRADLERMMDIAGDYIIDLNLGEIETTFGNPSVLTTWAEVAQEVVAERD